MQSHAIAPAPAKTVDNARPLHYNRCTENRVALAQLDRASGYGPEGRGFESLMLRQVKGHREVGALLLGVASRDELLAARKVHAARGSAAAKPTLSPAAKCDRGSPFEYAFSFSLSQPYGEYPSYKRAPQSRCPFCWRIPSICPRREQKSRFLYRFPVLYGKTKSDGRQN